MELDFSLGDVFLWQEWYRNSDIRIESRISCLYQLQQPREGELDKVIRSFHSQNGYQIHSDTKIVTGLGSTQVIMALIYAFSQYNKNGVKFWEQKPYYMFHRNLVELSNQVWLEALPGKKTPPLLPDIEFVTSPNNPDGSILMPKSKAPIILWDAVYAWSWYGVNLPDILSKMKDACKDRVCIPIFSFSKSVGLAGQRVGYALIPPNIETLFPNLLKDMDEYITTSTLGTCRSGEGICRVIASTYFSFPEIEKSLQERYEKIGEKLKSLLYGVQILSPPKFPYLWLKLNGVNLYEKLKGLSILSVPGEDFGVSCEYARLNLMCNSATYKKLLDL